MDYEGWVAGYKVRAFDWIDGKNIYLNIGYYAPGASLFRPPVHEKSFLLPKEQEELIRTNMHSVVVNLMTPPKYRQAISPVQKPEITNEGTQMRLSPNDPQVIEALKILSRVCGYADLPNLSGYLRNIDFLDPGSIEDLKALASEISHMSPEEMRCFSGALDAESVNGIKDVLQISKSLEDYTFLPNICTETDLGRFLVYTGYKDFPEEVQPYLDYRSIGIEYYAERGGAFTARGYVQRKGPELTQEIDESPPQTEQEPEITIGGM